MRFFFSYSESGMEEDDELYYDCVYREDEGDEVYEDLMKVEVAMPNVRKPVLVCKCRCVCPRCNITYCGIIILN